MRSFFAAFLVGIVMAGASFVPAMAQQDVLLPSTNNSNLGLVPGHPPSQTTTPQTTPVQPIPQENTTAQPPAYTPVPTVPATPGTPSATAPANRITTHIVPLTVVPPEAFAFSANYPNSITITIANTLDPKSIDHISDQLGISTKKVASQCSLAGRGMLQTDKGPSLFDSDLSNQTVVRYDGNLTQVMVSIRALCTSSTGLPADKGFIFQYRDRYAFMVGSAGCIVPQNTIPTQVIVTSNGLGAGKCEFK